MAARKLTNEELIDYLSSVINVLADGMKQGASPAAYVCGNGPTFAELAKQAIQTAKTKEQITI